jgi:hypothetical protein
VNIDDKSVHHHVTQGPGSSTQIAGHDQNASATVGAPAENRLAGWTKFLIAVCVIVAVVAFILALLDKIDWGIAAGLVIAFLAAPGILVAVRKRG